MSAEFIEPTRQSRRKLLLLGAIAIAAAAAWSFGIKQALFGHLQSLPLCEQLLWSRGLVMLVIFTPALFAIWQLLYARKLLKFQQSPPPGTLVFRRTPIKRGRAVRYRAYLLIACSAVALLLPIWGVHLFAEFYPTPKQCAPNLSLNPDASPAALTRRPLGAG